MGECDSPQAYQVDDKLLSDNHRGIELHPEIPVY